MFVDINSFVLAPALPSYRDGRMFNGAPPRVGGVSGIFEFSDTVMTAAAGEKK